MKDIADSADVSDLMAEIGRRARAATRPLAAASAERKYAALIGAAEAVAKRREDILAANADDLDGARAREIGPAMLDRLRLDRDRIADIEGGLRAVAEQPDPVGAVMADWTRPSGLRIRRVRTPLGVVGVIYESRPNVTADAGALCLKAGNAVILRGGSESFLTSGVLHECLVAGLTAADLPADAIQRVPTRDRAAVSAMLAMTGVIDVIVPRGGKGLVGLVQREARVPVFAHLEGIVHVFVDADADPAMAIRVVLNAKTRRTAICGAAECLLLHRDIAPTLGRELVRALIEAGVEVRADPEMQTVPGTVPAKPDDWGREFLDMVIAVRVVDDVDAAAEHVRLHGSEHTDCIVTGNDATAERFAAGIESAIVMRNASTQFADGSEFGMGAEIGIATGRLHARGPVGAEQLTSFRYLVEGDGTVRP